MKRIFFTALVAAATTWVSCTPDKKTEETEVAETTTDEQTEAAPADTAFTDAKRELLQTIAQHNMMQMELGKLASQRGASDEVKQHAQEMVQLSTNKQKELQELAKNYNVNLSTTLDSKYRDKYLNGLNDKKAADFDNEYWKRVTDAQKETLNEYDGVVKDITEADATAFGIWARTSEKELRAQYEQALAQQQELKNDM